MTPQIASLCTGDSDHSDAVSWWQEADCRLSRDTTIDGGDGGDTSDGGDDGDTMDGVEGPGAAGYVIRGYSDLSSKWPHSAPVYTQGFATFPLDTMQSVYTALATRH